jgi:GNAT superfamily N-acetyltransferase
VKTIQLASHNDVNDVLKLLNEAASWLHTQGFDQWPNGFSAQRIAPIIDRGEMFIVRTESGHPAATVAVSSNGDADFWTVNELAEPAHYVAKLATSRTVASSGLGELLLRWTVDRAARQGMDWVRLDAWRTNSRLHDYYRRAGWAYIRTEEVAHRRSGALFQRAAVEDSIARRSFIVLAS